MNSMTGFGSASASENGREISIEIKSVNHRFLDLVLKLPKNLSFLENPFRERVGLALSRGHVELFINYINQREDSKEVRIDVPLLKQYLLAFEEVKTLGSIENEMQFTDIMRMQDVLTVSEPADDQDEVTLLALKALDQALLEMEQMRAAEGKKMKEDIKNRIHFLNNNFNIIEKLAPTIPVIYAEKTKDRIQELLGEVEVDQDRLANEIAVFADKCNIDEEIARFHSHISQLENMLDDSEPVGRKMDFALQEINREVNTIGSKANNADITKCVLDLKAELEKIREQIQNIE